MEWEHGGKEACLLRRVEGQNTSIMVLPEVYGNARTLLPFSVHCRLVRPIPSRQYPYASDQTYLEGPTWFSECPLTTGAPALPRFIVDSVDLSVTSCFLKYAKDKALDVFARTSEDILWSKVAPVNNAPRTLPFVGTCSMEMLPACGRHYFFLF